MNGVVVSVATGDHYVKGQRRLINAIDGQAQVMAWHNILPTGSPSHKEVPYAFKAHALQAAAESGHTLLLWADASILPIAPLGPLFERIQRDGYWVSRNGWINSQWTADSAYADLGVTREQNEGIPHVVSGAFGMNLEHPIGRAVLGEFVWLAKTKAFCGPWKNCPETPCGPADVLGHRHDQTALSVIAWKHGLELSDPPSIFAYKGSETKETVLLADGSY